LDFIPIISSFHPQIVVCDRFDVQGYLVLRADLISPGPAVQHVFAIALRDLNLKPGKEDPVHFLDIEQFCDPVVQQVIYRVGGKVDLPG
jgi:hypothetical protein